MINFKMDSCQKCFWSAYGCIVVTSCLQEQQERLQFQYSHTQCSISSHRIIRNNISPGLGEINNRDSFSTAMAQIYINNGRKKKHRAFLMFWLEILKFSCTNAYRVRSWFLKSFFSESEIDCVAAIIQYVLLLL